MSTIISANDVHGFYGTTGRTGSLVSMWFVPSFSWCTSRMDRNMITVMSGQVVDFFDRDFRELYAVSEKLHLYKEFHVKPPASKNIVTTPTTLEPKRPFSPVTTSRFQVSLGDSPKAGVQVPAHKYHNPKYLLMMGDLPRPSGSLQELTPKMRQSILEDVCEELNPERLQLSSSEKMNRLSPLPSQGQDEKLNESGSPVQDKGRWSFRKKLFVKTSSRLSVSSQASGTSPSPTVPSHTEEAAKSKKSPRKSVFNSKKQVKKMDQRVASEPVINSSQDSDSKFTECASQHGSVSCCIIQLVLLHFPKLSGNNLLSQLVLRYTYICICTFLRMLKLQQAPWSLNSGRNWYWKCMSASLNLIHVNSIINVFS